MCRVPARVAPPPVFRVSPQLLEHGIGDAVHASVDESCIPVEKFSDRSLDSGFSRTMLLVDCPSQLPPVLNCDPSETLAGEKGTACVPNGGSVLDDPQAVSLVLARLSPPC
jgi:hypothetical protein